MSFDIMLQFLLGEGHGSLNWIILNEYFHWFKFGWHWSSGFGKDHTTRVIITMMEAGKQQTTYHDNFGTVELKIYKTFFYIEVHASPWYRCSTLYHQLYQFVVFRLCSVFQITISLCDSISFLEPTHHHKLDQ